MGEVIVGEAACNLKAALEEGEHYLQGGRRCLCCCDTEVFAAVWSIVCLSHHVP